MYMKQSTINIIVIGVILISIIGSMSPELTEFGRNVFTVIWIVGLIYMIFEFDNDDTKYKENQSAQSNYTTRHTCIKTKNPCPYVHMITN